MKKSHLLGAMCVYSISLCISATLNAAAVSGHGTWESTLQGRDLDGNAETFEGYYDTTLDINWLANAGASGTNKTWAAANAWAVNLNVNGVTGWRLPTVAPINGSTFDTLFYIKRLTMSRSNR